MAKFNYAFIGFVIILYGTSCSKESTPTNIYDSEEYQSITKKELLTGESIWATSCFRCHRHGINGAVIYENKEYWDKSAEKGIDALFKNVWEGYKGEHGVMPAKGFCNLCNEDEIRKSVIYTFHLARKAQAAKQKQEKIKKEEPNL